MWETLEPHILEFIVLALGVSIAWMTRKGWLQKELGEELKLDVQGAVTSVYHEYVKAKKAANEDGKLTDDEKKEARTLALTKLKDIGSEKGMDYAKKYGVPALLGLVEKYVTANKAPKKEE